jgi:hypothetical protein
MKRIHHWWSEEGPNKKNRNEPVGKPAGPTPIKSACQHLFCSAMRSYTKLALPLMLGRFLQFTITAWYPIVSDI